MFLKVSKGHTKSKGMERREIQGEKRRISSRVTQSDSEVGCFGWFVFVCLSNRISQASLQICGFCRMDVKGPARSSPPVPVEKLTKRYLI